MAEAISASATPSASARAIRLLNSSSSAAADLRLRAPALGAGLYSALTAAACATVAACEAGARNVWRGLRIPAASCAAIR